MTQYKNISIPAIFTRFYPETNTYDRDLLHALDQDLRQIEAILDRGILFADNVDSVEVSFTSNASPNTEDTTAHGLGKIPIGYWVIRRDKAGILYDSGTDFDATNIYTKCDVASTAFTIIVF